MDHSTRPPWLLRSLRRISTSHNPTSPTTRPLFFLIQAVDRPPFCKQPQPGHKRTPLRSAGDSWSVKDGTSSHHLLSPRTGSAPTPDLSIISSTWSPPRRTCHPRRHRLQHSSKTTRRVTPPDPAPRLPTSRGSTRRSRTRHIYRWGLWSAGNLLRLTSWSWLCCRLSLRPWSTPTPRRATDPELLPPSLEPRLGPARARPEQE